MKIGAALLLASLLVACAAPRAAESERAPDAAPQSLKAETDDLGMAADWALQLAERYGRERVLVVFDIDNTLLAMEQGLGSDQWYYWQKELQANDPCSELLVGDRLKAQGALFFASAMRPTQDDAAAQVARLQDAGLTVIALTSRGPDYRLQTFRELRRNGISFWPAALPPQLGYPEPFQPEGGSRPARYEDGVFLTAGQHKGLMLEALLVKTGATRPLVVLMVDDKADNLDAVLETFNGGRTAVHAWRYTREDANVAALDTGEAAAQWEELLPALKTIEAVLGPDNFTVPAQSLAEGCD